MAKHERPTRDARATQAVATEPARAPAEVNTRVIVLQADWREFLAGKVLRADADMQAALAVEHVKFRDATASERALAGVH